MLHKLTLAIFAAAGAIGFAHATGDAPAAAGFPATPHVVKHHYRPGEILVKFKSGDPAALESVWRQLGAVQGRALRPTAKLPLAIDRWRRISLPRGSNTAEVLQRFRRDPRVEYAEPNYLYSVSALPNDPQFPNQWGLRNTGQSGGVTGADIAASQAWDLQRGSASVLIAVIDTGVDHAHPDITPNLWRNPGEIAGNGLDDDGNGYVDDVLGYDFFNRDADPADDHGHGTHVAGIAAAVSNNGVGISGVAWHARVMSLKAFGADGRGDLSSAVEAILYANQMGARILNNSWGSYTYSQALADAIAAVDDAGGLIVAGAGNNNSNNDVTPFYPASYDLPNVIAVAATNRRDARASFSNHGRVRVHLGAPGDNILSLGPGTQYFYRSGTSMAAPHVAGAAALLLAADASLRAGGLKSLLLDRSRQTAAMFAATSSGGRLDAHRALDCDPAVMLFGIRAPTADFAVLEAQPTALRAQVTRCGHAVPAYEVTASFSNGDGMLALYDDGEHGDGMAGDGLFGNYWLPQNIGDVTVTLQAAHPAHSTLSRAVTGRVRTRVRYQHADVPYAWVDADGGTDYPLGNDGSVTIPIPFSFGFYGLPRSEVTVNANGLLTFGSSLPAASNSRLPDPRLPNDLIAALWDDLDLTTGGSVRVLSHGSAPNRRLTVSWLDVARRGIAGTASFQATLHEGSNDIVLSYRDVDFNDARYNNGAGAVVGVEDPDGLDATVFSSRQRLVRNSSARRFYTVAAEPDLTYRVTVTVGPSIRAGSGELVMSVVDGDGVNSNYFSILQFASDGDMVLEPQLTGDASGSFLPGPAHLGDANFVNEISQPTIFGNRISFLMRVSRNGSFEPFADAYAFYLLDDAGQPYKTSDPFGTDALFAIEIDRTQPAPQVFQSAYASAIVETVGAPVADAGGPYVGVRNQPLSFDGSRSYDPEGQPIFFNWSFGDGGSATGPAPVHVYAAPGSYTATLVVDDVALYSAPATAQVTIGASQPPVANAGPDQTVDQQQNVMLSGAASSDDDGSIVSYNWRQLAGPSVQFAGNGATVTFTAPLVSTQTTLTFELTVRDDTGDADRDTVAVTVRKNNLPPVANAGPDQQVAEGAQVTLRIDGSSDPDGGNLGVEWLQIAGPVAPLSANGGGSVSFTAPNSPADAVLTFRLTVRDDQGASDEDTVNVSVRNLDDPLADAGPDQSVEEGLTVQLDGSASSDPDGSIAGYAWEQVSGVLVTLNGPHTVNPGFTAPEVDTDINCVFRLTVTDDGGRSATDFVSVLVRNVNRPPNVDAGTDRGVDEGSAVTLAGSANDPDGSLTSWRWQQLAGPEVPLAGAASASASFTAPAVTVDTPLVFQLEVADNSGASATDSVTITVRNVNQPPVARAGTAQHVDERSSVALDGRTSSDPDGNIASWNWAQIAGPAVTLNNAASPQPTFEAPAVVDGGIELRFRLVVTDNEGTSSAASTVSVTVRNLDEPPVADAGADQTVLEGANVTLDGGRSHDPDGAIASYRWHQDSGPAVTLSGETTPATSFVAPAVSAAMPLMFTLTVIDDQGISRSDAVRVTVLDRDGDADADGLPDGWEIQHFGDVASEDGGGDPDGDGLSNLEEYRSGSDPMRADGAPSAVTSLRAIAGDTDVALSFGAAPGATRYDLYWSTSPSVTRETGTRIANVSSPYLHGGRANGATYYYVVVAANLHGESADSVVTSARPGPRAWGNQPPVVAPGGFGTRLLADRDGNAQLVYYRERVFNGPLEFYSVKSGPTGWGQPVLIASTKYWQNDYFTNLRAAMNRRGDTVVVWTEDDGLRSNLWSSFQAAGSSVWEAPRLLENDSGNVVWTDVSMGDDGLVAAAWIQNDGGGQSSYASTRRAGTGWSLPQRLDATGGGNSAEISVAAGNDAAHFAWTRNQDGARRVLAKSFAAGNWQATATLFDNAGGILGLPAVAIDAAGNGLAVYSRADSRGRYDVKASRFVRGTGWAAAATTIDGATGGVLNVRLAMRPDGRAVVAWTQGSSLYANLMSASGSWSGLKALAKTAVHPQGLIVDSLGRGLAIWSQTENGVSNTYSSLVSSAGWTPRTMVENATASTFVHGLAADDYGNATTSWNENGYERANTFRVGNPGVGGGGGGGGGGGPKPKSSR